jgi:hypothetical protein
MSARDSLTERQKVLYDELVAKCLPQHRRPRPKVVLVCVDGKIIADAVVIVSPRDKNWRYDTDGEVVVRRERSDEIAMRIVSRRFGGRRQG